MRALPLGAVLVVGLAACGGSGEPKKELQPGTLTIGGVVASARDRLIADGARIDVGEMNSLGGIAGKVRVRFITARDAGALVRRGARAVLLPCEPGDQARAESALRGRDAFAVATCNSLSPTRAWGAGPSLRDRADGLFGTLRDQHVDRVAIAPGPAAPALRHAAADWGVDVTPTASTVVTGDGWKEVSTQRGPVYGLDRLDSAAGIGAAGPGAEGAIFATFGFPVPGSELDELYEKYRLDHGAPPDGSEVQLGYDGVRVIGKAVEQAKTTDPAALAANLPGLSIGGAGGVLDYPEDGSRQPRADVAVVQVRGGRLELVQRGRPERP